METKLLFPARFDGCASAVGLLKCLPNLFRAPGGFRTVLRQARVNAARTLLEHSLCSIKQIAAQVWYSWTSQFDWDLHRECGMTPGQYRLARSRRSPAA